MKLFILKLICTFISCGLCFISGYLCRMAKEMTKKNDIKKVKTFDDSCIVSPKEWRKYND